VAQYEGDPRAFWFDRAVVNFGSVVEDSMQKASSGKKTEKDAQAAAHQALMKWLDFDGKLTKQRFAAPPITKTR